LEEEYFKFTVIETEKESYRIKCNNLENQVKRLESEITHMNNELQNNKKSLLESETR
jgi:chaperonin cofactor prefoldin